MGIGVSQHIQKAYSFFINSEPIPLVKKNPEIMAYQIEIKASNYDFLSKDSYINCYTFYDKLSFSDLVNGLINSPSKILGHIQSQDLERVIQAVKENPTFNERQKNILTGDFTLPAL